jgi:hypothetical protein
VGSCQHQGARTRLDRLARPQEHPIQSRLNLRLVDGSLQPCKVPPRCALAATHRAGVFCYDSPMRGLADIHLDVRGGDIIVDLPGTRYTVTYHKPAVSPQLLAAYLPGQNDPRTELTQAEFLARAWRLANEKARELDWIV